MINPNDGRGIANRGVFQNGFVAFLLGFHLDTGIVVRKGKQIAFGQSS